MRMSYFKKIYQLINRRSGFKYLDSTVRVPFSAHIAGREKIAVHEGVQLGRNIWLDGLGGINIGNGVVFGPNVTILSRDHYYDGPELKAIPFEKVILKPVSIGSACWIGQGAIILPGVCLGEGCVVGAGAVVTTSFPAGSVVLGNPGKQIKSRNMEVFVELQSSGSYIYCQPGKKVIK